MADFLGTKHHELHFTVQEGLDCLHDLIYHLESFEQAPPTCHPWAACAAPGLLCLCSGWPRRHLHPARQPAWHAVLCWVVLC